MSLSDEGLALPAVKPLPTTTPLAQCPYCGHVSPPGSKFCNECGAALHLLPCPHCGAVNDISLFPVCARCNWDLRPPLGNLDAGAGAGAGADAVADVLPAGAPATAQGMADPPTDPLTDPPTTPPTDAATKPPTAHPQPLMRSPANWTRRLNIGLVLIGAAAAFGAYTYMKRMNTEAKLVSAALASVAAAPTPPLAAVRRSVPAPPSEPRPTPAATATPTVTDMPRMAPPSAGVPRLVPTAGTRTGADTVSRADTPAARPARPSDRPPTGAQARRPKPVSKAQSNLKDSLPATNPATLPAPQRPADGRTSAVVPKPAVIGPCTDGVAALGLCTRP